MGGQKFFEKLCGAFFGAFRRKCGASQFGPINHTGKDRTLFFHGFVDEISFMKNAVQKFVRHTNPKSKKVKVNG